MTNDLAGDHLRRTYDAQTAEAAERLKFAIGIVDNGTRSLMLINGGALIALFTFIGNARKVQVGLTLSPQLLWFAFVAFSVGLVLTMLAMLGAFLSQNAFYAAAQAIAWNAQDEMAGRPARQDTERDVRAGQHAQYAAVGAAVLSIVAFVGGCAFALAGVLP